MDKFFSAEEESHYNDRTLNQQIKIERAHAGLPLPLETLLERATH
jgi:hypothetical protein